MFGILKISRCERKFLKKMTKKKFRAIFLLVSYKHRQSSYRKLNFKGINIIHIILRVTYFASSFTPVYFVLMMIKVHFF